MSRKSGPASFLALDRVGAHGLRKDITGVVQFLSLYMNLNRWKSFSNIAVLLLIALAAGPGCRAPRWNVSTAKVTPASVEVDLVGVTPSDEPYWKNMKPDDYWKPDSQIRAGATKVSTRFQNGQTWVLRKDDPIWQAWSSHGVTEIMVIANLPGTYDNSMFDRRRLFLPLKAKAWRAKDQTLEIEVQDEFVKALTPSKARR